MEVRVIIERGKDSISLYAVDDVLPFGLNGSGCTVEEAKSNFLEVYEDMRKEYKEDTGKDISVHFVYQYDVISFFEYVKGKLSMPALEELSKVNQKQLHHYSKGLKTPKTETKKKIEEAIHSLGKELLAVRL